MKGIILASKSQSVLFYDLTTSTVLRTQRPGSVQTREGSNWKHLSVIGTYTDSELSSILEYLRAAPR
jgi:hypothetical protein